MSLAFAPQAQKNVPEQVSTVQKLLDENSKLIDAIKEYQNVGRAEDALKYQQLLHRNLVYLAKLSDQSLLSQLSAETESPKRDVNTPGSTAEVQQGQQQSRPLSQQPPGAGGPAPMVGVGQGQPPMQQQPMGPPMLGPPPMVHTPQMASPGGQMMASPNPMSNPPSVGPSAGHMAPPQPASNHSTNSPSMTAPVGMPQQHPGMMQHPGMPGMHPSQYQQQQQQHMPQVSGAPPTSHPSGHPQMAQHPPTSMGFPGGMGPPPQMHGMTAHPGYPQIQQHAGYPPGYEHQMHMYHQQQQHQMQQMQQQHLEQQQQQQQQHQNFMR